MSKKDSRTGARTSILTVRYGRNKDRILYRGIVRRGGHEWKFASTSKEVCEGKIAEQLAVLEQEGVSAAQLSVEQKHDAARARKVLGDGETLEAAMNELRLVRDVLGSGRKLADALEEIAKAKVALGERGSIAEAVAFWTKHNPEGKSVTLKELCDAYLKPDNRQKGGASPAHIHSLRFRMDALKETFGEKTPVATLMPGDIEGFLNQRAETEKWAPLTFNHWRTILKSLFSFADAEYHVGNAAAGIKARKVVQPRIRYFTPEEAEKILRAAEQVAPDYAAATAILLFAGVRPTELVGQYGLDGEGMVGGLEWNRVDVDGEIVVDEEIAKTNQRRTIPIAPNLAAWLARYGKPRGRVVPNPTAWRRARREIARAAGVDWFADAARHSFATYHYALHRNRDALEAAMGHVEGGSAVLEKHYKGLERKAEAERYFGILPEKEA